MEPVEQCQVNGCQNLAEYALYKTCFCTYLNSPSTGIKRWIHVCGKCEEEIGNENMRRAGRYYTKEENQ